MHIDIVAYIRAPLELRFGGPRAPGLSILIDLVVIVTLCYSGVPHTRFHFWGEGSLRILGFGVPSRPNPSSGALNSTLPGPREGTSILNAHLVVMSAVVPAVRIVDKNYYFYFVFGRCPAELGPETRSNGSGSKNGAEHTQN